MMSRGSMKGKAANCQLNPKCCYESHDLECPNKFNPPLLSTPTEFCTEVLAKGIPIPTCTLAKPKKLVIEKEPPPLAKPTTSRHLKNWQRWCYIWRQTYNTITTKRKWENRPPVMTSGEVHRYKKEDKELFDRTLHTYHLNGFYIKNTLAPDSIRPHPCGEKKEIHEVITKRYLRDFPEMKRQRYPNYVRNEISLAPRKAPPGRAGSRLGAVNSPNRNSSNKSNQVGFNWEDQWSRTKHVEKMKEVLECDIGLFGKTDPIPNNLIFKPVLMKDGPSERIYDKKANKRGEITVPQLIFSTDKSEGDETSPDSLGSASTAYSEKKNSKEYYTIQRGPILRVRSQSTEIVLTFSKSTTDMPHFISNPASISSPADQYYCDENHHFSITTKCKDMKFIVLKNEGTTSIRYQWFRNPPNMDAHKMLQNPTEFKSLRLSLNQSLDSEKAQENVFDMESSEAIIHNVTKTPHLEFHFSELPGVILPGQSLEFPIIFRSKKPGFFHETMYLLTHPRVNTLDGRYYSVGLSGVCTDIELAEKGNELHEQETLKCFLNDKSLEEESVEIMDSILDRALWNTTNNNPFSPSYISSLPNGRITAEGIFYAHNKDIYYYFGKSEKALDLAHQLHDLLVPNERKSECEFSVQVQFLYDQIMTAREEDDLIWEHMCTSETEDLLTELNECMLTLSEQRIFSWPTTERRKYIACYTTMVVTFDEILLGFDRLHNFYNADIIKLIDKKRAEELYTDYMRRDYSAYWDDEEEYEEEGDVDEHGEMIELDSVSERVPPLTDPIPSDVVSASEDVRSANETMDESSKLVTESRLIDIMMTQPPSISANQEGEGETEGSVIIKQRPRTEKEHTALTLEDTMMKRVEDDRRQILTEARIKLFEDTFCERLEIMLSAVDSFNNMLDYGSSDAVVCIDDLC